MNATTGHRPHHGRGHHDHGHDEHDLGLHHDLAVMSRRRALFGILGAAGLAGAGLAGCAPSTPAGSGAAATTTGATTGATGTTSATAGAAEECAPAVPGETAGPYPGDGSNGPNVLIESGVHRSDIRTSFGTMSGTAEGVPVELTLRLQDLTADCGPGSGMAVYLWQADREGNYSLYSSGVTDQNYLRGVQTADADGVVRFTTILPGCYDGRWPHLHFEVYDTLESAVAGQNARLTSQIAIPAETCEAVYPTVAGYEASVATFSRVSLESDNVFSDGWDAQLPTVTGDPATGLAMELTIGVAAAADNVASGPAGGPPGGRGPGGPGGQPPAGAPGAGPSS